MATVELSAGSLVVVVEGVGVVVVSGVDDEVDSGDPGNVVEGDGRGEGRAGSGNRSSIVTGGHILAAFALGAGAPTTARAATSVDATTRAAPSLACILGRLTPGPEVGNPALLRYVGGP